MNRTKILVFVAFVAMLVACGPDDGSPPSLKNSDIGDISPFDTIVAEFNSKIVNIDKLNEENMKFSQLMSMIIKKNSKGKDQTTSNKLYFVGTNETASCGLTHLKPNKRDSIILMNLKNEDDYIQKKAVVKFFTYPIFDSDPDNDKESNPYDLKLDKETTEVTFAGTIGVDDAAEWADFNDYFKLSLKAYDSLYVRLSNTKDTTANASIVFPLIGDRDSTIVATFDEKTKTKYIAYKMEPEFIDVPEIPNVPYKETPVEFKIKVCSKRDLTPYLLWVKIVPK